MGAQCGLKPNEILDMSLDVVRAVLDGYSDHMFDLQLMAVQSGFWSGYYQSKKPRPLKKVIESMYRERNKGAVKPRTRSDEVDVEGFLRMEEEFQRRLAHGE